MKSGFALIAAKHIASFANKKTATTFSILMSRLLPGTFGWNLIVNISHAVSSSNSLIGDCSALPRRVSNTFRGSSPRNPRTRPGNRSSNSSEEKKKETKKNLDRSTGDFPCDKNFSYVSLMSFSFF